LRRSSSAATGRRTPCGRDGLSTRSGVKSAATGRSSCTCSSSNMMARSRCASFAEAGSCSAAPRLIRYKTEGCARAEEPPHRPAVEPVAIPTPPRRRRSRKSPARRRLDGAALGDDREPADHVEVSGRRAPPTGRKGSRSPSQPPCGTDGLHHGADVIARHHESDEGSTEHPVEALAGTHLGEPPDMGPRPDQRDALPPLDLPSLLPSPSVALLCHADSRQAMPSGTSAGAALTARRYDFGLRPCSRMS